MNYLAHMVVGHCAGLDASGVLGNFIGDAVKGRDVEGAWGASIGRGIRFHRALDDVSDRHEASRGARSELREMCGKWSGVVWDVLVDHVLAKEFHVLAPSLGSLPTFAKNQERLLAGQKDLMPDRSRRFFEAMVSHGWLTGYKDPSTVDAVLRAMSRRRDSAGPIAHGWTAYLQAEDTLREQATCLVLDMKAWGKQQNLVSLASSIEG